ncbi:NAD(P)H-hydrate dehydratase [Roseicyclus mahoneyensis]|nr:NAD(P)H-hydrate dehydratase [Roseicyclus mahoneyensis]
MRAVEQADIATGRVTGLQLMEAAGRGVVEAVFGEWPELAAAPRHAVVLCGPGNNGGDGFVVARLLKAWGWEVEVYLYGNAEKMPPDAQVNYKRWREMGEVGELDQHAITTTIHSRSMDLLVDAIFGTGLKRGVDLPLSSFGPSQTRDSEGMACQRFRCVAIDVPSGICSDSGRELGGVAGQFCAQLTVTFHREKLGHRLGRGPRACGKIVTVDIGLDSRSCSELESSGAVRKVGAPDVAVKRIGAHKFSHGHALILSGPMGRSGAARLAARGALRVGAGLVTVGAPGSAMPECAAQLTAIMLQPAEDAGALATLLEDGRINALCLGPGLGVARARALVPVALTPVTDRAVVLDADALTAFAGEPAALFAMLHPRCVLTPHGGEFARLFPDIAEKLDAPAQAGPAFSKVDATREAAARAGCVVLFKGPDTVMADASGACSVHSAAYERATPWLATAGSGDVLAGMIAGLMAQGRPAMKAAEAAAWLHVEAARAFGPGLIAEDLPEMLPRVFLDLGL